MQELCRKILHVTQAGEDIINNQIFSLKILLKGNLLANAYVPLKTLGFYELNIAKRKIF